MRWPRFFGGLDERGDELGDHADLNSSGRRSVRFGGWWGSGVPGLIAGSRASGFRQAPTAAAIAWRLAPKVPVSRLCGACTRCRSRRARTRCRSTASPDPTPPTPIDADRKVCPGSQSRGRASSRRSRRENARLRGLGWRFADYEDEPSEDDRGGRSLLRRAPRLGVLSLGPARSAARRCRRPRRPCRRPLILVRTAIDRPVSPELITRLG